MYGGGGLGAATIPAPNLPPHPNTRRDPQIPRDEETFAPASPRPTGGSEPPNSDITPLGPPHPGASRRGQRGTLAGRGCKGPPGLPSPFLWGSPFAPAGRGHSGHSPFGGRAWRCSRPPAGRSAPGSPAAPPPRDARPDRGAGGGRG